MKMLVIGAGAGGAAATVELSLAGHDVTLWNRSPQTLEPFKTNGIAYDGVLGEGVLRPAGITASLRDAVRGADAALVTLPTFSHGAVAQALAEAGWSSAMPVILNPGHTGGALEFHEAYRRAGAPPPPIAEFSTLTYVARKYQPDHVTVSGRAGRIRVAALPGGAAALAAARQLYPAAYDTGDVLASDLSNVNMVLHPPGAVLAAAWVEATRGDFTFYVEGMTPGVVRVMAALDNERRAVAAAFGHDLPTVIEEMRAIGTVSADAAADDYRAAISDGEANRRIRAPDTLTHRYYVEDFGYGLTPFLALATIANVQTPVAAALSLLGDAACGVTPDAGRTAERMGIAGLSRDELMRRVRGAS